LPPEIGQLKNLQWLGLSRTPLSQLPPEIGQLTNLQTLGLSFTSLSQLPPEIGQLKNLQTLYLPFDLQSSGSEQLTYLKCEGLDPDEWMCLRVGP
jgi:internalin A